MVVTPEMLIQTMLELALLVLTLHGVLAAPDPECQEDNLPCDKLDHNLIMVEQQLERQLEIIKTAETKIQEVNERKPDLEEQKKEAIRLISAGKT